MREKLDDRVKLVQDAAEAMRKAGRLPELDVLHALPDDVLRAVLAHFSGPLIAG